MSRFMETTRVGVGRTVGQIQGVLARCGATAVMVTYSDGDPSGISFKARAKEKEFSFMLPCRWDALYRQMAEERVRIFDHDALKKKAKNVAWRQLLRWVEAQMAMIGLGQTSVHEVFMPYMLMARDRTFFQIMESSGWNPKQLTEGK